MPAGEARRQHMQGTIALVRFLRALLPGLSGPKILGRRRHDVLMIVGEVHFGALRAGSISVSLIEEMLMMRPNLRAGMPSITCRHILRQRIQVGLAITASHWVLVILCRAPSRTIPALLTRISIGPTAALTFRIPSAHAHRNRSRPSGKLSWHGRRWWRLRARVGGGDAITGFGERLGNSGPMPRVPPETNAPAP